MNVNFSVFSISQNGVGNNIAQVAAGVLGNNGNNVVIGQMPPQAADGNNAAVNNVNVGDNVNGAGVANEVGAEEHEAQGIISRLGFM